MKDTSEIIIKQKPSGIIVLGLFNWLNLYYYDLFYSAINKHLVSSLQQYLASTVVYYWTH